MRRRAVACVALLMMLLESKLIKKLKPGLSECGRNSFVAGAPCGVRVTENKVEVAAKKCKTIGGKRGLSQVPNLIYFLG